VWDFFYGPDRWNDAGTIFIGPRVYDIDVVEGLVAVMQKHLEAEDARVRETWAAGQGQNEIYRERLPSSVDPVRIFVNPPLVPGIDIGEHNQRVVEPHDVRSLSASERARLRVTGGGVGTAFYPQFAYGIQGRDARLVGQMEAYLRAEGSRQFPWARLASVVPFCASVALVVLWIVTIASHQIPPTLIAYGTIITLGALAAGIWTTRKLAPRTSLPAGRGHRFREGSRAEIRAAVLNIRVGILTGAGGAVLGAVTLAAVQKIFGIDIS